MKKSFLTKSFLTFSFLFSCALSLCAQGDYLPPTGSGDLGPPNTGGNSSAAGGSPPPVLINGKTESELNDDDRRKFLQSKIKTISQQDGQVELIHVAPGYPVSLRFSEPILDTTVGDKKLISVQRHGKVLLFSALSTSGDTPIQVFFGGDKMRLYHVFASDSFIDGDSSITIEPFAPDVHPVDYQPASARRDLRDFIKIIGNYDTLKQEGALDTRNVSRDPIFRESKVTGYTVFYLYRIHGAIAFTFAYRNIFPYRVRLDESRIRLSIGNSLFMPDYVSIHDVELEPRAVTTGLVILFNPTFDPTQPIEIVWK